MGMNGKMLSLPEGLLGFPVAEGRRKKSSRCNVNLTMEKKIQNNHLR